MNVTCVFNSGLAVALQLLHGDIEQLRREYMVLFTRGVSITKKLGFSDVIMPGELDFCLKIYGFEDFYKLTKITILNS